MKCLRRPALLAATVLALVSSCAFAGTPRPFQVDFDKCVSQKGPAPYVVTFTGPASGDVSGDLTASLLNFDVVEPGQTYIQADYSVTGTLPFTARVGGRAITGAAVLNGFVSAGPEWLIGADVHDEFDGYNRADGVRCAKGTLYITPRWKQTHDEDD